MTGIIRWPRDLLVPQQCVPALAAFTRSGGRSLGGVRPSVRTDLGFWTVALNGIMLRTRAQVRAFEAIAEDLGGASGRVAVPVYAFARSANLSGRYEPPRLLPHDDGALFSDGASYAQGNVSIVAAITAPIGATTITLRRIAGSDDLSGVFFSHRHALYRTGRILEESGDLVTVKIGPSVREQIDAGADLEFDAPTCLCNLESDSAMTAVESMEGYVFVDVKFVEDTHYWSQLALGLAV